MNGRVWIKAKESKQVIAIARCIEGFDPGGSGLDEEGVVRLFGSLEI
jgi:exosome complex component RRP40